MTVTETSAIAPAEAPYRVPPTGLTVQQNEFIRLYLLKGSAYAAYLQAFSVTEPRDRANARTYAYRLLKTVEVKQQIRDATDALRRRLRIDATDLLRETAAIARSSIGDYFEFDSSGEPVPKPALEIDAVAQRAVRSIERTERKFVHRFLAREFVLGQLLPTPPEEMDRPEAWEEEAGAYDLADAAQKLLSTRTETALNPCAQVR